MENQLDPAVVNLAKAIRQTESGGNFNARGKAGEIGAYQFTPATWAGVAPKYGINVPLEQATPEQQNAVVYNRIKEWKDAGHDVTQIASMWNAEEGEPLAYTGRFSNGQPSVKPGVFDVPGYAAKVAATYQSFKQTSNVIPGITENTTEEPKSISGFASNILPSAFGVVKGIGEAAINVLNPNVKENTLANLGKLGIGVLEKLVPGTQEYEKYANAAGDYFKNRYGGKQEIADTIYKDPVGFLLDVSTVLSGGASVLKTAGKLSTIAGLETAGNVLGTASKVVDPIQQAANAFNSLSTLGKGRAAAKSIKLSDEMLGWTAGQKAKNPELVNEINKFDAQLGNVGDKATRLEFAKELWTKTVDEFNAAAENSSLLLEKEQLIKELEDLKSGIKARPNYSKALNSRIDTALEGLDSIPGTKVTGEEIASLKKDFDGEVNYTSGKITTEGKAAKEIADFFRDKLAPEMEKRGEMIAGMSPTEFMKNYRKIIEYYKQVQKAAGKAEKHGIVSRALGAYAGNKIGQAVGGLPGEIIGTVAGEAVPNILGGTLAKSKKVARLQKKAAGGEGITSKVVKAVGKKAYYSTELKPKN